MDLPIPARDDRMSQEHKRRSFPKTAFRYQSLPFLTILVLVGTFLLLSFSTNNNYFAAFAASVPCCFMLWKWVCAGREVDAWRCANCGQAAKNIKKMMWKYPPDDCPHCGDPYV
jgi:hypothetical protein